MLNLKTIFATLFCGLTNLLTAQMLPELPNTASVETCFPDTTGYAVLKVGPGGNYSTLQAAIDAATPGTILLLDAQTTFSGSFNLPEKTGEGWIILMSLAMQYLPKQGERVQPNASTGNSTYPLQKLAMPNIEAPGYMGLPCFHTTKAAHHYRFVGLEMTLSFQDDTNYGLMQLGKITPDQTFLSDVPHHIIIDRCYLHGNNNTTLMKAGVLLNCADAAVIDSHISDIHSIGYDTYTIGCVNGPGPFKIINNYLEAAGENILFGGTPPAIYDLIPSDIEIRNNHFYKPFYWWTEHPTYLGKHWTIKNLFELKRARRVLLDGNIFENCWADLPTGQSGYAILLTVRNENGVTPTSEVSDITITNNIIRHTGAGISISGHDDQHTSLQSQRIRIANNLFYDIDGPKYGDGNINGPNDGTFIKIGDPADVIIDHNTVFQSGPVTWVYDTVSRISITNNLFHGFLSAGGYQGIYGPGFAHGGNGPMGRYFPDMTDANQAFHKNILIGSSDFRYSNYNTISQNYFPATVADIKFTDYAGGSTDYHGYRLMDASPFSLAASDSTDIGVRFSLLDSALQRVFVCQELVYTDLLNAVPIGLYPNPAGELLTITWPDTFLPKHLKISDVSGREMYSGTTILPVSGNRASIGVENLYPGLYFLAVQFENGAIGTSIFSVMR